AAQQPEIETMTGWLTAWGRPTAMPSNHSGMGSMPGMMSDPDMAKLMAARGKTFDRMFLTMMITHHRGAVTMSRQEVTAGVNPDAVALAKTIITDQQAEITQMSTMLAAR